MTRPDLEVCIRCQEYTGKGGRGDDSLYASGFGPYCGDCWHDIPHEFAEQIEALQQRCRELEAENKRLSSYNSKMDRWIEKWTFPGGIYDDAPAPPKTGPWPGKQP